MKRFALFAMLLSLGLFSLGCENKPSTPTGGGDSGTVAPEKTDGEGTMPAEGETKPEGEAAPAPEGEAAPAPEGEAAPAPAEKPAE